MPKYNIPENTDTERLNALGRHPVVCRKEIYFTPLTQNVSANSIHEFADYVIHIENFRKAYGYEKEPVICENVFEVKATGRLKLWLQEGRMSTQDEDMAWDLERTRILAAMNSMHERKPF